MKKNQKIIDINKKRYSKKKIWNTQICKILLLKVNDKKLQQLKRFCLNKCKKNRKKKNKKNYLKNKSDKQLQMIL